MLTIKINRNRPVRRRQCVAVGRRYCRPILSARQCHFAISQRRIIFRRRNGQRAAFVVVAIDNVSRLVRNRHRSFKVGRQARI